MGTFVAIEKHDHLHLHHLLHHLHHHHHLHHENGSLPPKRQRRDNGGTYRRLDHHLDDLDGHAPIMLPQCKDDHEEEEEDDDDDDDDVANMQHAAVPQRIQTCARTVKAKAKK